MLRQYQKRAIEKMIWSLGIPGNSVVSMPVGSGKTHVISGFVEETKKPLLILVPSKELLEQDLEKLLLVVDRKDVGIYSASMNEKLVKKYTLATIQSAYKRPQLFVGFETVIIDECHNVNPKNLSGMYNTFFQEMGNPKIIGLTATPYRLDSYYHRPGGWTGYSGKYWQRKDLEVITTTKMIVRYKERFWHSLIYVANTKSLQDMGYLCKLTYENFSTVMHETLKVNKSKSDFDLEDFEGLMSDREKEIVLKISLMEHKSVLVFCSTVDQAERLSENTATSRVVVGTTSKKEREEIIDQFRSGELKIIFNVGVLTTGFDHPELDAIVMLRPTKSLNLYNQMLGRGTRNAPDKETCTIYDYAGNYKSMGSLEGIQVVKQVFKMDYPEWNVISDTNPNGLHMKSLYKFKIKK